MAYDEKLAVRVRSELNDSEDIMELKMMGGLCFMVRGNMFAGVDKSDMFVRMDRSDVERALRRKHAIPFEVGGKVTTGYVRVKREGVRDQRNLRSWLLPAMNWAATLPPKKKTNS